MQKKRNANQRDNDALLNKFSFECRHRAVNQRSAVVCNRVTHIRRQAFHGLIQSSFDLLDHLTALAPEPTITSPPPVSPSPVHSALPRRISGPGCTFATSRSRIGTPFAPVPTATFFKSSTELTYPRTRKMNSFSAISMDRPPTSPLLFLIAVLTSATDKL